MFLAALAPVIAAGTAVPDVQELTLALAPLLSLSAWSGAAAAPLMREQRFALLAARALVGQPLALAFALALARAGAGAWAMIASQAVLTLTTATLLLLRGGPFPPFALHRGILAELWRFAGPQIASITVLAGRYRIFMLALGLVAAPSVVALSHMGFRLLDGAMIVVYQSGFRIGLPRLAPAHAAGDRERMAEVFGSLAELQALVATPIAVGIALVAPDMVAVMLGPAWAGAAEVTRVVALAVVPGFLLGDAVTLLVALGRTKANLAAQLVALVLPVSLVLLVRPETPRGVAFCAVGFWLAVAVPLSAMALRAVRRPVTWLLGRTLPALAAAAAMGASVLAVRAAVEMTPGVGLLVSVLVGAAVYLAVAAALLRFRMPAALRVQRSPAA